MAIIQKRRLGEILVIANKINQAQLDEALKIQKEEGMKLGEVLVEKGFVTEYDIIHAIEQQIGIKEVDLGNVQCDKKVLKIVPQKICDKHMLAPFGFEDGKEFATEEVIRNMIREGIDYSVISRVTKKAINEIECIRREMLNEK